MDVLIGGLRAGALRIGAALATAVLIGCNDVGTEPPPPPGGASRELLQHIIDSSRASLNIPGAVVLVRVSGGAEYVISSGLDNVATGSAMGATDRFRVGSITKTMVATVVLQLADEGQLSLNDTIAKWLPGIVANADRITISELLNHTSGVPNYTDNPAFEAALLANPSRVWSPMEAIAIANQSAPSFTPGATGHWEYSNTNYILLGMLIERVTGIGVGEELQRRIFDPLHLTNTYFATTTATPAPFSRGYLEQVRGIPIDVASLVSPSSAGAAGAVVSTAHDLTTWAEALASGALVSPALQNARLAVVLASGGQGYGLGIEHLGSWIGHTGQFFGYESLMFVRPGVGTLVILTNKSAGDGIKSFRLFDEVRWAEFGEK